MSQFYLGLILALSNTCTFPASDFWLKVCSSYITLTPSARIFADFKPYFRVFGNWRRPYILVSHSTVL